MCGIIGIVGERDVTARLLDGLRRMEYRGYDSAGLCTIHEGQLLRRRAEGKLRNLVDEAARNPAPGATGIAHTRWATHGAPTERNAHPHATAHVALVHNGIIENFKSLRDELVADGRVFESETDTETMVHLLSREIEAGLTPTEAVRKVLPRLRGAFALAIAFRDHPDMLIGARLGSPLVVGFGEGAFVGLHGSWNRQPLNGYEVVFVPFTDGRPTGSIKVVLFGFVDADGNARGRPVGVAVDGRGGLLVADDVGNSVWRITPASER